jgi:glucose-6-phosphate 1-dehydrogenase
MEMPHSFSQEGLRDARVEAMQSLQCIEPTQVPVQVVRGQYRGYREEQNVDPNSKTETFVAMKAFMNSPRWDGVPFYMRIGKELPENEVEVSVVFKQTCHLLFKEIGCPEEGNILTIRIQPDEGITIKMIAKRPGSQLALEPVKMSFNYSEQFGTKGLDAYEKILLDIFTGDQMLFNRSDELEYSWTFIEQIFKGWEQNDVPLFEYDRQSWGPEAAKQLIEKDGRKWI